MRVGSLFSGAGLGDLGLEWAGFEHSFFCEIDDYARKVLKKRYPGVTRLRDIREVRGHMLPPIDLLCGGFPCQDLSHAGKRAGLDGARSGLWGEYLRLIREIRPRYILVENVPGLLSLGMGTVLGDLAESGYDAEWRVFSAAEMGAPHLRKRVFILAYPRREGLLQRWSTANDGEEGGLPQRVRRDGTQEEQESQGQVLADTEGQRCIEGGLPQRETPADSVLGIGGEDVADPTGERPHNGLSGATRCGEREPKESFDGDMREGRAIAGRKMDWWSTEPQVGRVANGVPSRVDRLKCLGNGIVPQITYWIGRRILEAEGLA